MLFLNSLGTTTALVCHIFCIYTELNFYLYQLSEILCELSLVSILALHVHLFKVPFLTTEIIVEEFGVSEAL